MAISIRNPRVEELARELGEKENLFHDPGNSGSA
jgi:hypothetical protein